MRCLLLLLAALAWAQRPDPGPSARPDPAREAALKELIPLTAGIREDDHPAVASRGGRAWVAWVSYSETEGTSNIYLRAFENGVWSDPLRLTETAGDCHKPAIAVAEASGVWVAWPAQVNGNWDIYGRVQRDGKWSKTERWTSDPAPDLAPRLAASGSQVMLVWQALRRDNFDILYRVAAAGKWGPEGLVTEHAANDWEPALAASRSGAFHAAWDSYRGDYDVVARTFSGGRWGPEIPVASSARLENRASLALDAQDRLWVAWEIGPERWASDSANAGLHARRDIGLACLQDSKLYRAEAAEKALLKLAGEKGLEAPALAFGQDGRLRLWFRQNITPPAPAAGAAARPAGNVNWLWAGMTAWDGAAWTPPEILLYSEGRVDQRLVLADLGEKFLAVWPSGSSHNVIHGKFYESGRPATAPPVLDLVAVTPASARPAPTPLPRHTLHGYQLVWGDLHRHTDISEDGGILDGSLHDAYRYALDAAALDFLGVADHTRYLPRRYNLWRMQQTSDLFHKAGVFVPVYAYERSQASPWGHRNIIHLNRDYAPVPASYDIGDPGVSPLGLFQALRGQRAISIPHTSAWVNRQVSWDYNDPDIEPLVEIYQGLRSTYEYNGAPDPAGRAVYEKDSRNFVWDALARKLKLGFIASSDHRSTHMSYAAVYAKARDRASIFEGLKSRRTYAATDRILVDFTIGKHLMGEEIWVAGQPELEVSIEGAAELAQSTSSRTTASSTTSSPAPGRRALLSGIRNTKARSAITTCE